MPRPTLLPALILALLVGGPAIARPAAHGNASRVLLPDDAVPLAYRITLTPHVASARFEATVDIDVDVRRPTRRLVLNSAELAIDRAALDDGRQAPRIVLDARRQTASFVFAHPLVPGRHTLRLAYRGRIFEQAAALFRLKVATPDGESSALFTQFEDSDARRFLPCWDEPARKAVFELTAVVPDDRMAVGNMPVVASEPLPGGLKRVRFAPTPRMASYLLFFGLGDFERVHREVDGVDLGVVVRRGDTASAAYALDAAAALLPWFNDYFGTRYPLPKMDMVAGAGDSEAFGAMENWGALFYFERDLLVDPGRATDIDRQRVFVTIAHEMAHQWFGDLVTMAWWDDLWLNEGFATWMEGKAVEALHPDWRPWLQTLARKDDAMDLDARRGTHPVIMHIRDIVQASGVYDDITYQKGAQVIRTLESAIGAEAFRAGVRRYLQRHAYASTTTEDFWRALDEGAAVPVTPTAHDLTQQPGVPLVELRGAACVGGRTRVTLAQSQFSIDRDPAPPRRWRLPVAVAVLGGGQARLRVDGPRPQAAEVEGCGPVIVNAGQAGYFRVRYTDAGLASLGARLAELAPEDQLGLLSDTGALALSGQLPMATLLALMTRVPADADPVVLGRLVDQLRDLDRLHDGLPGHARFRAFARSLLAPVFARVGWDAAAGEDANAARLREQSIEALGEFEDAAVLAGIATRFAAFVADPAGLPAALRQSVLHVVAVRADRGAWDRIHALARAAPTPLERQDLYLLLGLARDEARLVDVLALAVSGEPPATTVATLLRTAAERHPARVLAFLDRDWPRVAPLLDSDGGRAVIDRFFDQCADPALIPRLERFARRVAPGARAGLDRTESEIRYRALLRAQRVPEIDRWILARRG